MDLIQIALSTGLLRRADLQYKNAQFVRENVEPRLMEAFENAAHIYQIAFKVGTMDEDAIDGRLASYLGQEVAKMWRYKLPNERLPVEEARSMFQFQYKTDENFLNELQRFGYFHQGGDIHKEVVHRFKMLKMEWKKQLETERQRRRRCGGGSEAFTRRKKLTEKWIFENLAAMIGWPLAAPVMARKKKGRKIIS